MVLILYSRNALFYRFLGYNSKRDEECRKGFCFHITNWVDSREEHVLLRLFARRSLCHYRGACLSICLKRVSTQLL
jgi:hypothetical protein